LTGYENALSVGTEVANEIGPEDVLAEIDDALGSKSRHGSSKQQAGMAMIVHLLVLGGEVRPGVYPPSRPSPVLKIRQGERPEWHLNFCKLL
jgi:hypothetical protein